jgi:hypothetical protein
MKKNYNTLNEEINRIKSLFNEGRLYGNLVDKEEEIITEQRKFLSDITDAFSIALKTTDPKILKKFQDFMNVEIRNVDDIIKHVEEFEDLWRIVVPNLNTKKLKENLDRVKNAIEEGKLKDLSRENLFDNVLPGFPEKGGMRDMIHNFWKEAKGEPINLPKKVETRIVKTDPNTGELVIGTKNEKGEIVYKNKKGGEAFIENPPKQDSGSGKSKDSGVEIENAQKNEINLVTKLISFLRNWVDVPEKRTLAELDGGTFNGTKENIDKINDSVDGAAVGGGVFDQKQQYKTATNLSKEQEIKLKELEIEEKKLELQLQKVELQLQKEKNKGALVELQLQKEKNKGALLELKKKKLEIKNNPEGQSTSVPDGEPKTNISVDKNEWVKSESKLKGFLKLPKKVWDRVRVLRPKEDESGFIRVSKMIGSSTIDPLGLLRSANIPPIKKLEGIPGGAQKVVLPQNIYWAWGARRLGGLAINGIVWSWYFTVFRGGNPFKFLGYESDPNEYYFPKIYTTYWKNLAKTPFIGAVPKIFIEWGEKQIMELNDNVKKYTGKTLGEWEIGYIDSITPNTKKFLESKSCEELKAMRTEGDNPVLKPESKKIIAEKIATQYHEEMEKEFVKLEKHLGYWAKIVEYLTELKLEMPKIAASTFEGVKTDNGESVIEEQFSIEIIKKCTNKIPNFQEGEEEGEESIWYVEGDLI